MPTTLLLALLITGVDPKFSPAEVQFFENKIRPVLVESCYGCHSQESNKTRGGLSLDSRAGLLQGGDSGPAVVAGKPEHSLLIRAIHQDGDMKMPPNRKLPATVIADFEKWIAMGVPDPRDGIARKGTVDLAAGRKHWAFLPVVPPARPVVKDTGWSQASIDQFVLARLEANHLRPASDAAPAALLRRLTFDLTGLPPSPDDLAKFDPAQLEATVDRLLASPRFGEHWGRVWLDGVRYDSSFPSISFYRDWVIRSFNEDLPYDRFLTQQLAGDLLPEPMDARQADALRIAAQFLTLNAREMDPVEGMVEVVGQQLLGVSLNCAKCHDHKFDPFLQTDYYAMAGIFTSSQILGSKNVNTDGYPLQSRPGVKIATLAEGKKIGDTPLLIRGERDKRGSLVPRGFPVVLAGEAQTPLGKATATSGRLNLATWLTNGKNPLTARVFVNRVWQNLLGKPLVRSPNDFGVQGIPPTHPELLDYLADRFVKQGWSLKQLIREIVLSRTYRQSSRASEETRKADPENDLLGRANLKRLRYEQIVDNLLAVSGQLREGPPVLTGKKPVGGLRFDGKELTPWRAVYLDDIDLARLFDGADPELLVDQRGASVTAPQLLFFLNNKTVQSLAGRAATRVEQLARGGPVGKVNAAYRMVLGREPHADEIQSGVSFLEKHGTGRYCHLLFCTSEFIYVE